MYFVLKKEILIMNLRDDNYKKKKKKERRNRTIKALMYKK